MIEQRESDNKSVQNNDSKIESRSVSNVYFGLKQIKRSNLKNLLVKHSNSIFKLFEAELFGDDLKKQQNMKEGCQNVYLLEKFCFK